MAVNLKALLETTQLLHPNEVQDQTCPVCYDDYLQDQSRELPRKLPCGHIIGTECLLQWASAQDGTTAIRCPWCTKPFINSLGAEQFLATIMAYTDTRVEQVFEQIENQVAAMDLVFEEQKLEVVGVTILLVALGAYFDTALAWLPLYILALYVTFTTAPRLVGHRRLGLLWIGIGCCVGESVERDLGLVLVHFGGFAYRDSILRFYLDHPWLVLGGTFGIFMVLRSLNYPDGGMMETELVLQFVWCGVYNILMWMMR